MYEHKSKCVVVYILCTDCVFVSVLVAFSGLSVGYEKQVLLS